MKKRVFLFVLGVALLLMTVGCSSKEYEEKLSELDAKVEELKIENNQLRVENDKLMKENGKLNEQLRIKPAIT